MKTSPCSSAQLHNKSVWATVDELSWEEKEKYEEEDDDERRRVGGRRRKKEVVGVVCLGHNEEVGGADWGGYYHILLYV